MQPNTQFDVIIVGSGPAGVHAAYPLVKAGLKVAIIDGGLDSRKQDNRLNAFLGTTFKETSNAYNLVKKSSYVFNKTYQLLKIRSKIEIIQSLAKGGLAQHWHGICDFFSKEELERIGLPANEILKEYVEVSRLIRLKLNSSLDHNAKLLLKSALNNPFLKSTVYSVPIAFPYYTSSRIEYLKRFKNFTYIGNQLVYEVKDKKKYVEIQSFSIDKSIKLLTNAKFLILAAGSINTTRILMRSLNLFNYKTTFLTKSHYLTACVYTRALMKKNNSDKPSLGQLVISSQETNQGLDAFFVQLYKFNTRAIHKVLKYIPLPKFMAFPLLSFFSPSLMIADVRFPAFESKNKFCRLIKKSSGEDVLEIFFKESVQEIRNHKNEFIKITQQLRSLGLFPIKTTKDFTTSHYAGGVPYKSKKSKLSVDINGKLHQAKGIYIADAATWRALPAKAPTLTIMANASRVGKKVLENFSDIDDNILK